MKRSLKKLAGFEGGGGGYRRVSRNLGRFSTILDDFG